MPFTEPPPPPPMPPERITNPDGTQTVEFRRWLLAITEWLKRFAAAT